MKSKFLITGGTGKTGRKVAQMLNEKGMEVRIGSRSADIPFDWNDQSTWAKAIEGVTKVYITYQPDLAVPGATETIQDFVELAKTNQIEQIVILSGKGEKEAENCEEIVMTSGIDYTILRCSWFNQNFSESFFLDPIIAGHVQLPKAEAKVPYVDTDDIAEVAVEAFLNEKHKGQLYELTGPRLLNFREVIAEISKASERDIQFYPVNLETYVAALKENQVPDEYVWLINYLFSEVLDAPGNNIITKDVQYVLGRPAKDFSKYAIEAAATGVWNQIVEA